MAESVLDELLSEAFEQKLQKLAEDNAEKYRTASPFPHIVFDNFLPEAAAEAALLQFPQPKQLTWSKFDNQMEKKLAFQKVENLPQGPREVLYFMNTRITVKFLETLTGIKNVIPDPWYEGGGLHQIVPGGKLGVHADFNYHPRLQLDRRINMLIYLNKDWDESYGGHFELWNKEMTQADVKILPLFNRCAIFSTTSTSWHGHPNPLTCPDDRTRKSLATYYYTNGRPEEERGEVHSTVFKARPGEDYQESNNAKPKGEALTLRKLAYKLCPPILYDAIKKK